MTLQEYLQAAAVMDNEAKASLNAPEVMAGVSSPQYKPTIGSYIAQNILPIASEYVQAAAPDRYRGVSTAGAVGMSPAQVSEINRNADRMNMERDKMMQAERFKKADLLEQAKSRDIEVKLHEMEFKQRERLAKLGWSQERINSFMNMKAAEESSNRQIQASKDLATQADTRARDLQSQMIEFEKGQNEANRAATLKAASMRTAQDEWFPFQEDVFNEYGQKIGVRTSLLNRNTGTVKPYVSNEPQTPTAPKRLTLRGGEITGDIQPDYTGISQQAISNPVAIPKAPKYLSTKPENALVWETFWRKYKDADPKIVSKAFDALTAQGMAIATLPQLETQYLSMIRNK